MDLVNPGYLVFNRVFHGDDLLVGQVYLGQGRVKSCGFSASGGPGYQDNTMRPGNHLVEDGQHFLPEAQFFQLVYLGIALVEDTHYHALAIHGGECRDTKVDFLAQDLHLDPAVLGYAPLGDVELGHDLDPGDHRRLQSLGGRFHVNQHAVNPVTYLE